MQVIEPAALAAAGPADLDALVARRGFTLVLGDGDLRGVPAAIALFADYTILRPAARLTIDAPETWAGAVWRIGRRAIALPETLTADEAQVRGLIDEISEASAEQWLAGRSTLALDSAAELIRRRGGDLVERTEFARLFAAGEPQQGLAAFLRKTRPDFRR
ncbi:MAG TPA: hypothetical protein VF111_15365 [Thermoanaerobaculia bacterium]